RHTRRFVWFVVGKVEATSSRRARRTHKERRVEAQRAIWIEIAWVVDSYTVGSSKVCGVSGGGVAVEATGICIKRGAHRLPPAEEPVRIGGDARFNIAVDGDTNGHAEVLGGCNGVHGV